MINMPNSPTKNQRLCNQGPVARILVMRGVKGKTTLFLFLRPKICMKNTFFSHAWGQTPSLGTALATIFSPRNVHVSIA
jgi:hypothetical protein